MGFCDDSEKGVVFISQSRRRTCPWMRRRFSPSESSTLTVNSVVALSNAFLFLCFFRSSKRGDRDKPQNPSDNTMDFVVIAFPRELRRYFSIFRRPRARVANSAEDNGKSPSRPAEN